MGKLKFNSWNPGFYKLMHIGALEVIDLCSDANVFTFTTPSNDSLSMSLFNDDILDYHDDKSLSILTNDYEYLQNDMINLFKKCEQIVSKRTRYDHKSDYSEHVTKKDDEKYDVRFMVWSVKKQLGIPGMIYTCALDTVLFLIYHIRNNWIYVNDRIDSCTETLKYAMQLMDINDHDMARYILTNANTSFSHIKESNNFLIWIHQQEIG